MESHDTVDQERRSGVDLAQGFSNEPISLRFCLSFILRLLFPDLLLFSKGTISSGYGGISSVNHRILFIV